MQWTLSGHPEKIFLRVFWSKSCQKQACNSVKNKMFALYKTYYLVYLSHAQIVYTVYIVIYMVYRWMFYFLFFLVCEWVNPKDKGEPVRLNGAVCSVCAVLDYPAAAPYFRPTHSIIWCIGQGARISLKNVFSHLFTVPLGQNYTSNV